jgi:iron complex outermembrane receptor protein
MTKLFDYAAILIASAVLLPPLAEAQQAASAAAPTDSNAGIQEIVVTANKREENLERVGLDVTAVSAQQLADHRIVSLQDVAAAVPGLAYATDTTNTPIFTLRGVGYNGNSLGAYPAVSIYIDEAPLPFPVLASHSAYDLQRIEVLKGPQGTLFGENSTGGAINYIAAKPTDHFVAGGDLTYGRFNEVAENFYISGPITPTLGARLSFTGLNQDGWQQSYTRQGDHNGSQSYYAGRLILDWSPRSDVRLSLNANGWIDTSQPVAPQFIALAPQVPAEVYPSELAYPFAPQNARAADWSPTIGRPRSDRNFFQTVVRADVDLVEDITLTSLTSYDDFRQTQATEQDGTALSGFDLNKVDGNLHSLNQELRIASSAKSAFRWLVGGNFEKSVVFEDQILNYSIDSNDNAGNLFIDNSGVYSTENIRNIAGFLNAEYDLSSALTLRAGARYTDSKINSKICGYSPGDGNVATLFNLLGNLLGKVPFTPIGPTGCYTLNENFVPGQLFDSTLHQDNVSWRVGIDYKLDDSTLMYGNISRGFKAGSFPSLAAATFAQLVPVTQEELTAYEVGMKAQFLERRVQLNAATFYYDYKDKQILGKEADPLFAVLDILTNVPKSRIFGAEADLTVQPSTGLSVSAAATYLDSRIQSYTGVNVLGKAQDFAGSQLPFTPRWSGRLDGTYRLKLPNGGSPLVGLGVSAQSQSDTLAGASDLVIPPGPSNRVLPGLEHPWTTNDYATVDARIGYEAPDNVWSVTLWGKNILDKYYWNNVVTSGDYTSRFAGLPATFGVTVAMKLK